MEEALAKVHPMLVSNLDLFGTPEKLKQTALVEHAIDTGSRPPIRQLEYRVSPHVASLQKAEIEKMLTAGIIVPSKSAWCAPVVMVPKKDKTYRFCVDYRRLNAVTKKDSYCMPRMDDILEQVAGFSVYSTLDLYSGYWQIRMKPEDAEKTAFGTTQFGNYEFTVMPFGLTNAPRTFQSLMNEVLFKFIGKNEHEIHLTLVFDELRNAGLQLNLKKCLFFKEHVNFLGHVISSKGLATDPLTLRLVILANYVAFLAWLATTDVLSSYLRLWLHLFTPF